jgi:hypothetical protein
VLYYTTLYYTTLCYDMQWFGTFHYTTLYYASLKHTILCIQILSCNTLRCAMLHNPTVHNATLLNTTPFTPQNALQLKFCHPPNLHRSVSLQTRNKQFTQAGTYVTVPSELLFSALWKVQLQKQIGLSAAPWIFPNLAPDVMNSLQTDATMSTEPRSYKWHNTKRFLFIGHGWNCHSSPLQLFRQIIWWHISRKHTEINTVLCILTLGPTGIKHFMLQLNKQRDLALILRQRT